MSAAGRAPGAGRVRFDAYLVAASARSAPSCGAKTVPIVLAGATRTYSRPGPGKLRLKLTAADTAQLAQAKPLRVLLVPTFLPTHGRKSTVGHTITVGRP